MANAIYLLYDLCRLCLGEPGTHDIADNGILLKDILLCTGMLHITFTEDLPHKICSTCLYKIEIVKDLQSYSTKNDSYMKCLLDNSAEPNEIARPKVPLNKPLEEIVTSSTEADSGSLETNKKKKRHKDDSGKNRDSQIAKKPKIYVRSLADINSSVLEKPSSNEDEISHNTKATKKHTNESKEKEKSGDSMKRKCDSSSEKHETSSKKSKQSSSIENHKPSNDNDLKCDVCSKTYPTPRKLYMHRRSHSRNLYCPLDACGKSFSCKGDLQKHIRSHTGEKPYKCDLCDKSFTQNVTLKSHKTTHEKQ